MLSEPRLIERTAQPYVGIKTRVAMPEIRVAADTLPVELFGWMGKRGLAPAGAPFFKYNVIDMAGRLEIEWGAPIAAAVEGDGRVLAGILPAGRYAALTHTGPYDRLMDANAALLKWVADKGLALDASQTPAGERFGCRLELYLTDPRQQPDSAKWQTEVAFRLAG